MKVELKNLETGSILVLIPENEEDKTVVKEWNEQNRNAVFENIGKRAQNIRLKSMGDKVHACNEPVNIHYKKGDASARILSNLAYTPFELDGLKYASVESFWQGLKLPAGKKREAVKDLWGMDAKQLGWEHNQPSIVEYNHTTVRAGSHEHWSLMARALIAKFDQNEDARSALIATNKRPLVHNTKKDSITIPGVIFCKMLTKIRNRIENQWNDND